MFFSEILTAKPEKVKTCALSALEAPAGYGDINCDGTDDITDVSVLLNVLG